VKRRTVSLMSALHPRTPGHLYAHQRAEACVAAGRTSSISRLAVRLLLRAFVSRVVWHQSWCAAMFADASLRCYIPIAAKFSV